MSSYAGSFFELSPSDQADVMSFFKPDDFDTLMVCDYCDEIIDQSDVDVEAFEVTGCACCRTCLAEMGE